MRGNPDTVAGFFRCAANADGLGLAHNALAPCREGFSVVRTAADAKKNANQAALLVFVPPASAEYPVPEDSREEAV